MKTCCPPLTLCWGKTRSPGLFHDHELKGFLYIHPLTHNTKIQSNNITLYYTIEMYKRYFTSKTSSSHHSLRMGLLHSHSPISRRLSLSHELSLRLLSYIPQGGSLSLGPHSHGSPKLSHS
ncbi:unnamed protein product [Cuscuta epithymum]|uniref:Uncharacterized protein n=1 Tax=Cuscuta epithymum TaxID=186058 RepID=A0AAV0DWH7_9ASTE|nr:unnamed protein product [Cuscuta epithymum]